MPGWVALVLSNSAAISHHLGAGLFHQTTSVQDDPAGIGDQCGRQPVGTLRLLGDAAVQRVDVQGRLARFFGDHRHPGASLVQCGIQLVFHPAQEIGHAPDRGCSQKGHRAVRDPAAHLDLAPPNAPVAQADAVLVQRFRNDHMVDARLGEVATFRQPGDAGITAAFLVDRSGDLDRPRQVRHRVDQRLHRDDRRRQATFHVTGAAAVDAVVDDLGGERVVGPAGAGLDHVDMAVEMHARPGPAGLIARNHVGPWIGVGIAPSALGPQHGNLEPARLEAPAQIVAAGGIGVARRIDGGDADQVLGQRHQVVGCLRDALEESVEWRACGHAPSASSSRWSRSGSSTWPPSFSRMTLLLFRLVKVRLTVSVVRPR